MMHVYMYFEISTGFFFTTTQKKQNFQFWLYTSACGKLCLHVEPPFPTELAKKMTKFVKSTLSSITKSISKWFRYIVHTLIKEYVYEKVSAINVYN